MGAPQTQAQALVQESRPHWLYYVAVTLAAAAAAFVAVWFFSVSLPIAATIAAVSAVVSMIALPYFFSGVRALGVWIQSLWGTMPLEVDESVIVGNANITNLSVRNMVQGAADVSGHRTNNDTIISDPDSLVPAVAPLLGDASSGPLAPKAKNSENLKYSPAKSLSSSDYFYGFAEEDARRKEDEERDQDLAAAEDAFQQPEGLDNSNASSTMHLHSPPPLRRSPLHLITELSRGDTGVVDATPLSAVGSNVSAQQYPSPRKPVRLSMGSQSSSGKENNSQIEISP